MASVIMVLVVVMYLYQQKRKFFLLDHLISHYFLRARKKCKMLSFLDRKQILIMSAHVGSRLIFFLSVVGNFFLDLSVVSNIFRPLSLVG